MDENLCNIENLSSSINWISSINTPRTLSQYLNRIYLTELSKVNKNYRNQLKPQVLKIIVVSGVYSDKYREIYIDTSNFSEKFEAVIKALKSDLMGSHHLVKKLILKLEFSKQFANDLFTLFPEITHIEAYIKQSSSLTYLIESLYNSTSLQNFTLYSIPANFNTLGYDINYRFFQRLKTIKLYADDDIDDFELPFDFVDSSFTNLKYLTITNNQILGKLSNGLSSLGCIELTDGCDLDSTELAKFITNNSQLKKISMLSCYLSENVTNSLLALEGLDYLRIIDRYNVNESILNINIENLSINHISYSCYGYGYNRSSENVIEIFKMCKNLKKFEIDESTLTEPFGNVINHKFPEIDIIFIHAPSNVRNILKLTKLTKFKEFKFRHGLKFNDFYTFKDRWESIWKPKYDYSGDTDEFTFLKLT